MKAPLETKISAQDHALPDVIISGAGPVGLLLACELALAKCSVLVLERAEDPHSPLKQLPFGIRGLSAPTIETLDRRGLLDQLEVHKHLKNPHQHAKQGAQRQRGHFAGIPFLEGDIDTTRWKFRLPSSTDTSLISEMQEMEAVLSRRAASLGVTIIRGAAVTDFHQTADGVTVQSGNRTFKSKWLVGCDGSRSVVRKLAGFEFAGTEPEFTGYTTRIDMADPEKLSPGRTLTPAGMYMQSQPGYVVIQDFDGGAFHGSGQPVTLKHLQQLLRRISGTDVTISALHIATTWTDRARQATAYRNGRVLLAGDAAHIHAPLGGQGLNLGLGDAINLGWKLAATIQNLAPAGLLDSYDAERHPIGAQVLDWSRAQVAIMKPDPAARALNAILRDLVNTRDGATYFAEKVWGISTHYDLGGAHPLVGHSVPNFEFGHGRTIGYDKSGDGTTIADSHSFGDGQTIGSLMHEGQGLLLDFDSIPSLTAVAQEYGDRLRYISGCPKDRLGISAALVRPDGIVAWASDKDPDAGELQQALARWFLPETHR